ncbi:MAG: ferritin-like domain-containing protein [Chloroflexota bacterium]
MSYLNYPRLHFAGEFLTDPSTVNNDPYHYQDSTFSPDFQTPNQGAKKGWWNPDGSASWRMENCVVTSVAYSATEIYTDPEQDPVVGMALTGADRRVSAKLVDLDTEQQMVSEIWGMKINLGSAKNPPFLQSDFAVAPFAAIWKRYPDGKPDSLFSAIYQSVLTSLVWLDGVDSGQDVPKFLQELRKLNPAFNQLSIKFTVDGYDDTLNSPTFGLGRIVGAIGPYFEGEPQKFVAGRLMRPLSTSAVLNDTPCQTYIDDSGKQKRNELLVDFGNGLPTTSPGGPLEDLGDLQVAILDGSADLAAKTGLDSKVKTKLGSINYQSTDWYQNTAGIQSFKLTAAQLKSAQSNPLGVIQVDKDDKVTAIYLYENSEGAYARADDFVFRLDAHTSQSTTLYATKFGEPCANQPFTLQFDNTLVDEQVKQGTIAGPPAGTPESALTFPATVTTDADGKATIELTAGDPGNPRGYIDGQVYGVSYLWDGMDKKSYNPNETDILSVRVFDAYTYAEPPTWTDNIQPIFQQYANLYPVMRGIVDLSDYQSVLNRLDSLRMVFNLPQSHPNYMPVTRDLSTPKLRMIQAWLQDPRHWAIKNIDDLRNALQTAIELEHATIPTYLAAYWSIKPGKNQEVAAIIRSVVIEEMLHMALACNLLNAVGGSPNIDSPTFVPTYPGPLPGGLHPDLTVSLKKCSIEQIRDVFMVIEQPGESGDPVVHHPLTIGWFYDLIKEAIVRLNNQQLIFTGERRRQITDWPGNVPGNLIAVTDPASALAAIDEIVEQGEGASPINPEDGYDELAHYYKFSEIVQGCRIELTEDGFSYTGAAIPFDPDGVYPMIDNPNVDELPPDSLVERRAQEFNQTYATFLKAMHDMANGQPETMKDVVGMMYNLSIQGRRLMQTPISLTEQKPTAGPTFQLPEPRYFTIQSRLNDDALTISEGSTAAGANIVNSPISKCPSDAQLWELVPTDEFRAYYLRSKLNGNVVDIGGSKADATKVNTGTGTGPTVVSQPQSTPVSDSQLWELTPTKDEPNYVYIQNKLSGLMLDVYHAEKASGTNVQTCTSNKTPAQRWKLVGHG